MANMKLQKFSKAKEAIDKGLATGENMSDFELLHLQMEEAIDLVKCWNCGEYDAEKVCCKCQVASYCSRDCQLVHWKSTHKCICQAPCPDFSGGGVCQELLQRGDFPTIL